MRFSIIIATINRTEENFRLLKSIAAQQYNDIEVIFADQNNDDRLNPILAQYRLLFPILHLRSQKGLSRSRNEALAFAQGEIICFPDDDCWYPPNLLIEVDRRMRENPLIAGFTGRCTDEHGRLCRRRIEAARLAQSSQCLAQRCLCDNVPAVERSKASGRF